ncbi:hypothetical protein NDA18_002965 [Ustilago nuda]|nr:hypothetical protein NDA18_002965 [Ustilago nuda]
MAVLVTACMLLSLVLLCMLRAAAPYARTPSRVDPNNPPWPAYRGYHEFSFAHETMGKRLPTILGKAVDDVIKTLNEEYEEEKVIDLAKCIERMHTLMDDLQNNSKLRPIVDDGEGDIPLWNKEIARFFRGKGFMNAPWLFAEAYKYRRLHECFSISKYWKDYDVFFRQKCDTFSRLGTAVFELSTRFAEPFAYEEGANEGEKLKARELLFHELTQVCLWGNATDLSLLINMTEEDIKNLQSTGGEHLAATEKNILGNHLDRLWKLVSNMKGGRIDFILDNAGFELYCDCVYADWLIQSGIANEIRFHGKRFAWFVSDVTRKDWDWLLNSMLYGSLFPKPPMPKSNRSNRWVSAGKSTSVKDSGSTNNTPSGAQVTPSGPSPKKLLIFLHLADSNLVMFKGDLNHRKLTYDCQAPSDTPFDMALGPLASEDGAPPVASLRTIKSDVVVGVPGDVSSKLDNEEPGWRISGKCCCTVVRWVAWQAC